MPNIAAVLKAEISRLAKKESKAATNQLKKSSVRYRRDLASVKKLLDQQEKELTALRKQVQGQHGQPQPAEEPGETFRFSARSVRAQRKRLGLSALDYGKLVGVSPLTVYAWESGKARPRKAQFAALVAVRGIGKRAAIEKLAHGEQRRARKGRRK